MAMDQLADYFDLEKRSTTYLNEIRGGVACFLTMSYILLVNPQVLSTIGISSSDVGIGCIIAGLLGNLPFGLAPGIGLSAYLAYGLVLTSGDAALSLTEAYTACFLAGALLCILTIFGATHFIMSLIPKCIKVSTIVGMGLQITLVGMTSVKLIVANPYTLVTLGPLDNYHVWYTLGGLAVLSTLFYHNIKGSIIISIMIVSILTWYTDHSFPTQFIELPAISTNLTDLITFSDINYVKMLPAILSFLFIGLVDVSGVIYGMSSLAGIIEPSGNIPGSLYGFLGCGIGTMIGAMMGSTPVIVYVESAAGIQEGGKSGVTGIIVGIFFLLSTFFAPLFGSIPTPATAPVTILIGVLMMSQVTEIDWKDISQAVPAFLTLIIIPFTFSITNGILFGLTASLIFYVTTGDLYADIVYYIQSRRNNNNYVSVSNFDTYTLDSEEKQLLPSSEIMAVNNTYHTNHTNTSTEDTHGNTEHLHSNTTTRPRAYHHDHRHLAPEYFQHVVDE